jgi:hypothetical protein
VEQAVGSALGGSCFGKVLAEDAGAFFIAATKKVSAVVMVCWLVLLIVIVLVWHLLSL